MTRPTERQRMLSKFKIARRAPPFLSAHSRVHNPHNSHDITSPPTNPEPHRTTPFVCGGRSPAFRRRCRIAPVQSTSARVIVILTRPFRRYYAAGSRQPRREPSPDNGYAMPRQYFNKAIDPKTHRRVRCPRTVNKVVLID